MALARRTQPRERQERCIAFERFLRGPYKKREAIMPIFFFLPYIVWVSAVTLAAEAIGSRGAEPAAVKVKVRY
jgi:hypothetical protein